MHFSGFSTRGSIFWVSLFISMNDDDVFFNISICGAIWKITFLRFLSTWSELLVDFASPGWLINKSFLRFLSTISAHCHLFSKMAITNIIYSLFRIEIFIKTLLLNCTGFQWVFYKWLNLAVFRDDVPLLNPKCLMFMFQRIVILPLLVYAIVFYLTRSRSDEAWQMFTLWKLSSLTNGLPNLLCLDAELMNLTMNDMFISQLLVPNGQWDLVVAWGRSYGHLEKFIVLLPLQWGYSILGKLLRIWKS